MSVTDGIRVGELQKQPVNLIEIANRGKERPDVKESSSFKDMFSRELASSRRLEFSKHAQARLHSRGIQLDDQQISRMAGAVDKAAAKGSRSTLLLTDKAAFVVSVENRTVITAFDRDHLQEGVVTAIDSAVVL